MPLLRLRSALASLFLFALAFVNPVFGQVPAQGLFREVFTNITGTAVSSLTNSPAYPNSPGSSNYLTVSFEAPTDVLNNYGQRVRGYLFPPQTGNYTFWMASDDQGALFLSPNGEPANLARIAYVSGWTASRNWSLEANQQSASIFLEAGRSYYIEALMKEGGGGDNLAVKWQLPNGLEEEPIPASRLRPWNTPLPAPQISQQPSAQNIIEGGTAIFSVRVTNVNTTFFQWQRNGANIPGANSTDYVLVAPPLSESGAVFRCFVSNALGNSFTTEATLNVQPDLTPPHIASALNENDRTIKIVFDEPVDTATATLASNYQVSGFNVTDAAFGANLNTIILTLSGTMTYTSSYTVTVNNVRDRSVAQNLIAPGSQFSFVAVEYAPANIGAQPASGVTLFVPGGYDVLAAGDDIAGNSDQFRMDYQLRNGNFDIKVRVQNFTGVDMFSKAGLMARESLEPFSRFAGAFATPSLAGAFGLSRATSRGLVAKTAGYAPVNYPDTWLRLSRAANVFTAYASIDGSTWVSLGTMSVTMPAALYVGTAVASHDSTRTAKAQFRDIATASGGTVVSSLTTKGEPLAASSRRTGLIISEIMYHPADRADGKDLEFIEFFNTDPLAEDLSGFKIDGAIDYTFPEGTILNSGAFLVLAKDPVPLKSVYGIDNVVGPYAGALSNDSEVIRVFSRAGAMILEAHYADKINWPLAADGAGHSLVLARPSYGEAQREAWGASGLKGGSPGFAEPIRSDAFENLVINEVLAHTDDPQRDYIEIYNHSNTAVILAGCFLTDDRNTNKFQFGPNATIPARGLIAVGQDELGFALDAGGETIYFVAPNNVRVIDAVRFEGQANGIPWGRYPDGASRFTSLQSVTKGTGNALPLMRDIAINEIMYNPISDLDEDEYLELYNRGSATVDLSGWRFTDGIDFEIPQGTTIPAGGYLVVAKDAAHLKFNYSNLGETNVVGNYAGTISNSGERLALSMPDEIQSTNEFGQVEVATIYIVVAEVHHQEGGRWGKWSDGGGSSLELIDPRADPMHGSSWADSDETAKSTWTTIEFTGVLDNGGISEPNQFQMHLQGGGECLVDDVELRRSGGTNLIVNAGFENDLAGWVPQGAFKTSFIESTSGIGASKAMHVVSPVRGDTGANRIYYNIETNGLANGITATLRAKVRWLKGYPEFLMRVRGNHIEAFGRLNIPNNLGTPGLPNSRNRVNIGPSIYEVVHSPVLPAANANVVVTARVTDPDGMSAPQIRWRTDAGSSYSTVTMNDAGLSGDAIANDGLWSGTIPGQASGILVAFYVQAADQAAFPVTATFPADAPATTCLIRWGETQPPGTIATYRMWMTTATINAWSRTGRLVLDNTPLDVTFVYGNHRVIYNVGALYSGSPFHAGYDSPVGGMCDYVLNFREDELFLGATDFVLNSVGNLNNDNTGQREQAAFWIAKELGVPFNHRRHIHMFVNGARRGLVFEDAQQPNSHFVEGWFPDDPDGELLKIEDWFEFSDSVAMLGNVDARLGLYTTTGGALDTARYRWCYRPRAVKRSANDFVNFFELIRAVNDNSTSYTTRVENTADIEEWMRIFCMEHIAGNWDAFGVGRGKNMFTYRPRNGKWTMMAWDIDFVLGSGSDPSNGNMFSSGDGVIDKMYNHPPFRRAYLRAMQDAINGPLTADNMGRTLDGRYDALVFNGVNATPPNAVKTFVAERRAYMQTVLNANNANAAFAITSNGGNNFSTNKNFITISGTAPVGVKTIEVNGVPYPVNWNSVSTWSMTVPLPSASNLLNLKGYDLRWNEIVTANDSITIGYTGALTSPKDFVVINEIMYNAFATNASFLEIANTSTNAFDLTGYRLDGIDFDFPEGSVIAPNGFFVIAKNAAGFSAAYGSGIPIRGEFAGSLDNGGERLKLIKPGPTPEEDELIDVVRYDDDPPWPIAADGTGPSLQLIDPTKDNSRAGNWGISTGTVKSTPGAANNIKSTITAFPTLWINEVLPNNTNSITDGAGDRDPWIELYNSGTSTIDLGTYYLTDDYTNLTKWQFPAVSLTPGQFLIVWVDGEPAESVAGVPHTNFRLAPATGSIALTRMQGSVPAVVDYINYTLLSPNKSFGSYPDGQSFDRQVFHFVTPREANDNRSLVIPITINEWMASNTRTLADPVDRQYEDWFELYNSSDEPVDLTGYYLTDVLTNKTNYRIPPGYIVPPRGYLIVWADEERGQNSPTNAQLHAEIKLAAAGESIGLFGADGTQIDAVTFGVQSDDISEGRYPDAGAKPYFKMPQPTPGGPNIIPSGNKPPALSGVGDATIPEDTLYQFQAIATDADVDQLLTFSLHNAPGGAAIDPVSGIFSWTPGEQDGPGNFTMTIRVTDNGSPALSRSQIFTLTVTESNRAPEIPLLSDFVIDEEAPFSLAIPATDPDLPGQPIFYSLTQAPAGMSINANNGVLQWQPLETIGGQSFPITVMVTDGASPALSFSTSFSVNVREVNAPPLLAEISDKLVIEGDTLTITPNAADTDIPAQMLAFNIEGLPGAVINPQTGVITWTPFSAQIPSTNLVSLHVTDSIAITTRTFTVVADKSNRPPTFTALPDQLAPEDTNFSLQLMANDQDAGQTHAFTLENFIPGLSLSATGLLTWRPTETQGPSTNVVRFQITDSGTPARTISASINIIVTEVNTPPVFPAVPEQSATLGEAFTYSITANDSDRPTNTLTYSINPGGPTGVSINPSTGRIAWTPTEAYVDTVQNISIRVTDNGAPNMSDNRSVPVRVKRPVVWKFVSVTGTASSSVLYVYLESPGRVIIDDMRIVAGPSAATGPNLLPDGDFETALTPPWNISPNHSGSYRTNIAKSGASALNLVASQGGTTQASSIYQTIAPALTQGAQYTLSYWFVPTTNDIRLTVRLSGSGIVAGTSIFAPEPPPVIILNPTYLQTGELQILWPARAGINYRVWFRNAIDSGAWQTLTDVTAAGSSAGIRTAVSQAQIRFYRVEALP